MTGATDADHVLLFIEDDGPGIDPSERELVFKPFFKGDRSKNPSRGTGLGLAIVKGFVSLCDGTVAVDSSPSMTRFVVKLPLAANCLDKEA